MFIRPVDKFIKLLYVSECVAMSVAAWRFIKVVLFLFLQYAGMEEQPW